MTGTEMVGLLLCLVFGVVLLAVAWWVSGINTAFVRLAMALEARHIERSMERAAEKRTREAQQNHFSQWLAETTVALKKLQCLGEKLGEPQDTTLLMSSAPAVPPTVAPPSTVREPHPSDAGLLRAETTNERPRESDTDTLCWASSGSSRALFDAGIPALNDAQHEPARAQERVHELRRTVP